MAETDDTGSTDTVTAEPKVDPTPPPPPPKPQRSAALPLLGGVLAAIAGFGLAQVVPNGWPVGAPSTLQAELAAEIEQVQALKAQVLELSQQVQKVAQVADRVAKLEAAPAPQGNPALVAALESRIATLEARPAATSGDTAALTQLRGEIETLKAKGAGIVSPQIQASLDAKVAETEAKLSAIEASAQAQVQATMTRAAVRQIAAALDSGAPFPAAVADLAGIPLPAVLTDHAAAGLPSLQSLREGFPAAARAALDAALRANLGESWGERVTNFLRTQTGARSLEPREGNDPDAILSRAQAALAAGDLTATLGEIATLPPQAVAALADWQARAQVRLDAEAAVQALMTQAG